MSHKIAEHSEGEKGQEQGSSKADGVKCTYCQKASKKNSPTQKHCSRTCRQYASNERRGRLNKKQTELRKSGQIHIKKRLNMMMLWLNILLLC